MNAILHNDSAPKIFIAIHYIISNVIYFKDILFYTGRLQSPAKSVYY